MPSLKPVGETYFDTGASAIRPHLVDSSTCREGMGGANRRTTIALDSGLRLRWTSPRPFGVGTSRQGKAMGGAMTVDGHFFIWEEGRRYAFSVTQMNVPLFKSFAEDYVVEPKGADSCRFTWRIAITPSALGR